MRGRCCGYAGDIESPGLLRQEQRPPEYLAREQIESCLAGWRSVQAGIMIRRLPPEVKKQLRIYLLMKSRKKYGIIEYNCLPFKKAVST